MTFENEIDELVHLYQDGAFNRRELIRRVARVTGSTAAAVATLKGSGVLQAQQPAPADDLRVPEGAPDLITQMVEFPGQAGLVFGYLARPREISPPRARAELVGDLPAVLVIHENRGLNDHIKDVTRRTARAGFVALGIDLISRLGGTNQFPDPQQAGQAYNRVGAAAYLEDMLSGLAYLKTLPFVQADKLGAVGFCAGGGNCFTLAVNSPDLSAAVPYYPGGIPSADQLERLTAPVLGFFGETDRNVNSRIPPMLTTLLDRQKRFAIHIYEGAGHAFNNDTGASFNRAAATDAWGKTIAFFNRHLKGI